MSAFRCAKKCGIGERLRRLVLSFVQHLRLGGLVDLLLGLAGDLLGLVPGLGTELLSVELGLLALDRGLLGTEASSLLQLGGGVLCRIGLSAMLFIVWYICSVVLLTTGLHSCDDTLRNSLVGGLDSIGRGLEDGLLDARRGAEQAGVAGDGLTEHDGGDWRWLSN